MNLRAIGCLVVGVVGFVALGAFGLSAAFRDAEGCPTTLQWADRSYVATGAPVASPGLGPGEAIYIGSTFMGPITRRVYGPPGSSPSTDASARPATVALECGDGTYQTYAWDESSGSTTAPSGSTASAPPSSAGSP